jgi:homoserine kinase
MATERSSNLHQVLRLRVPCSTSNLGPGFDQLGLALNLHLDVRLEGPIHAAEHELELEGEIAQAWPREGNRLLQAFDAVGISSVNGITPPPRFRFHISSSIPLGRGLGSSGAATAAGLLLAAELKALKEYGGERPAAAQLEQLGVQIEGHPDNVIASLHGGCTLGVLLRDGSLRVVQQELQRDLLFPVAWPSTSLATEAARAALPTQLPLDQVVWNTRRLSLLLEGLRTGNPDLLKHGVDDTLHTPYRLPLIAGAERALQAARSSGAFFAAISGSGSALIAAHTDELQAQAIAHAMQRELARVHESAECRVLRADLQGAQLVIEED